MAGYDATGSLVFSNFRLSVLPVRDYLSKTKEGQRDLLPPTAGIYVWTLDLGRIADPAFTGGSDMANQLALRMKPVKHVDQGRVSPYHRATLQVDPKPLTAAARGRVERLSDVHPSMLEWSLLCGMIFQRPLYVGKAVNLRNRIRGHLREDSTLGLRLADVGLQRSDCTIVMAQLGGPDMPYTVTDESDGDSEEMYASGEIDDTDDDELGATPTSDARDIDDLVRTAESITIRMSHPLLNRKQD